MFSLSTSHKLNTPGDSSLSPLLDDFKTYTTPFANYTQHTDNIFPFHMTLVRKEEIKMGKKEKRGKERQQ